MSLYYEIHLQGHLDETWANWLPDFHITHLPDGVTQLVGTIQDQAALHGLFNRLRDLGIPILIVQSITEELYHEKTKNNRSLSMSSAKVIRADEGELCQISPVENIQLKVSGGKMGGGLDFLVDESGYLAGPPLHLHEKLDEVFYILSGEMRFQIGEEMVDVQAGDTLYVPKGVPHAFTNLQQHPAKLVGVIAPGGFDSFFVELATLPSGPPDLEKLADIASRYDSKVVGPPIPVAMGLIEG